MRKRLVAIHRGKMCPPTVNSHLRKGCIQQKGTVLRNGSAAWNLLLLNLEDCGLNWIVELKRFHDIHGNLFVRGLQLCGEDALGKQVMMVCTLFKSYICGKHEWCIFEVCLVKLSRPTKFLLFKKRTRKSKSSTERPSLLYVDLCCFPQQVDTPVVSCSCTKALSH